VGTAASASTPSVIVRTDAEFLLALPRFAEKLGNACGEWKSGGQTCAKRLLPYSPAPIITIGIVGVGDPTSFSTVIANALASTPAGSEGFTTLALP
jgi:hypothetical protein